MTQRLNQTGTKESQRGNALPMVVGVILVLGLVGWFVLQGDAPSPDDQAGEPPVSQVAAPVAESSQEPSSATDSDSDASAEGAEQAYRPGTEARELIARLRKQAAPIDLHAVHVRGVGFLNQGKQVDAYLVWFFAARQGHAPSAFVLGEMYDPKYFNGANEVIDAADPAQAYKWYLQAAESGDTTAEERLSDLMSRVENAARAGNTAAARLLLRMQ